MRLFFILITTVILLESCTSDTAQNTTNEHANSNTTTDSTSNNIVADTLPTIDTVAALVDSTSILDSLAMLDSLAAPIAEKIEKPKLEPPIIAFKKIRFDYDTIQQGDVIEHEFHFQNRGERPLVISNVKGSCGCTIGSYPFIPIAPKERGLIKARFDSKGKKGFQETTVTVYSNAKNKNVQLTLKGYVLEQKKD